MSRLIRHAPRRGPHFCGLILVVAGTACAPAGGPPAGAATDPAGPAGQLAVLAARDDVRVFDLTHPLSPDSLYWPTGSPFEHEQIGWSSDRGYWYASGSFSSPEHLGTHLDAPIHFGEDRWDAAQIPVERLLGPGVVLDISGRAAGDPMATLEPADIDAWERVHGAIPEHAIVIVRTGWAAHWPDWNAYYGTGTPQDVATLRFPGVSEAAAEALVERRVAGVGIDTASIDPGHSGGFEAHRVLNGANIYHLENLTGLESLPPSGFLVVALPMKIAGGSGGPARVIALVGGE